MKPFAVDDYMLLTSERVLREISERLTRDMLGDGPEDRVRALRASILGESEHRPMKGLLAAVS